MMSDKLKNIIRNLLLIFVFVSIGFALGKYSVSRRESSPAGNAAGGGRNNEIVHVYYMHATFRCVTCNTIEKMTKDLLERKFAEELKTKKIVFSEVNFQENESLAKKFDVLSSCVVVAKEEDGKITGYERLDKVWTLMSKPDEFNTYVSKAIESFLPKNREVTQ
jgi:hypothetical protein